MEKIVKEDQKAEFAKRLTAAMLRAGLTQSAVARRAAVHMPNGKFGRDSISGYCKGQNIPGSVKLNALARALGVEPVDLLPFKVTPMAAQTLSRLEVKDAGDGRAWLQFNQVVPWKTALEIISMLKKDEQ